MNSSVETEKNRVGARGLRGVAVGACLIGAGALGFGINIYIYDYLSSVKWQLVPGGVAIVCNVLALIILNIKRRRRGDNIMVLLGLMCGIGSLILSVPNGDRGYSPKIDIRSTMRIMSIALETYYLDHGSYPAWSAEPKKNAFGGQVGKVSWLSGLPSFRMKNGEGIDTLTTPEAYVSEYYRDPYAFDKATTFCYFAYDGNETPPRTGWILWSPGPDGNYDLNLENIREAYDPLKTLPSEFLIERTYDPTNGINSFGDIWRVKQ